MEKAAENLEPTYRLMHGSSLSETISLDSRILYSYITRRAAHHKQSSLFYQQLPYQPITDSVTTMASTPSLPETANTDLHDSIAADSILESLESLAAGNIPISLSNDEGKRLRFLEAARMASLKLEQPWDTMQRLIFCALPPNMAQVGIDLGLWKLLSERGETAISASELAVKLGVEKPLLVRILRYAATQWMVEQVDIDTYRATNITHYLSMSGLESVLFHV
jgi:hypothetical protein